MSKLKFYKKWKEDQAYSPTHEWGDEPSFEVENVTIDEPSKTSSPIPGKYHFYLTILKYNKTPLIYRIRCTK